MTNDVLQELRRLRIVPLIVMDDARHAVPLARALVDGGLPCAEVAFRTPAAADAITAISAEVPEILLGAGTVLNPVQAGLAREAGAKFIVSPGLNEGVVRWCQGHGLLVFPGVCTPTEVDAAMRLDLRVLKFFPAEPMGGLPFLKAIAAPFTEVEFMPTGGITANNLASYLAFDRVVACGGSWMAPQSWIDAGSFDRIRSEVRTAVGVARSASQTE
jgi:2-dehydro-3-deoxyphosphogluconate aldolase/(4S)-4-hydroxy-2-oxoglutarate aldolase